jgi:biotin operon repressor
MEQILDVMKGGDVVTAEIMARQAGCSARTVYRYVQMLRAEGHTILSEAGYGYLLKQRAPSMEARDHG